jgi:hypothetical protein
MSAVTFDDDVGQHRRKINLCLVNVSCDDGVVETGNKEVGLADVAPANVTQRDLDCGYNLRCCGHTIIKTTAVGDFKDVFLRKCMCVEGKSRPAGSSRLGDAGRSEWV